jgi:hypothetical protein
MIRRRAGAGLATTAVTGSETAAWAPKISCRQITTTPSSIRPARTATPIEIATSNRLPATTPAASSPIAISTTDRTMPNRITRELQLT